RAAPPTAIVTMGANGPRIHALLAPVAAEAGFALSAADDLAEAVAQARAALAGDRVVLLSPRAPSLGAYGYHTERRHPSHRQASFDPEAISAIPGLGIA